jgi:uncharacterized membrane protein
VVDIVVRAWSRVGRGALDEVVKLFSRYPEQKQARRWLGIVGVAFLALGIFLITVEAFGGVLFTVMGSGLLLLAFFANRKTFARALRVLGWFNGLS